MGSQCRICNYLDLAGSACGELFPIGNQIDSVDGIEITCIDNGMSFVVIRVEDMGITGYEPPEVLNANEEIKAKIESIRLQSGPRMNLGDVDGAAVSKMCMVAKALNDGVCHTHTFTPYKCHSTVGVLGAVSVATAAITPGTVLGGIAKVPRGSPKTLSVEHPSGGFCVRLDVDEQTVPPRVLKSGLLRTARLLSRSEFYVPEHMIGD